MPCPPPGAKGTENRHEVSRIPKADDRTRVLKTAPKALKEHIEKGVAEGEFTSPSDYVRSLVRAERAYREKRAALLRDIDAGLADIEAGRVYDGEEAFAEILGEEPAA